MHIVVCVKHILDPEMPLKYFKIDAATNKPVQGNASYVMDSYSENALEVGLQLKEKLQGAKVTVLTMGDASSEEVLRTALAVGADYAVRAWDPGWADLDASGVAHVLARAIEAIG